MIAELVWVNIQIFQYISDSYLQLLFYSPQKVDYDFLIAEEPS